MDTHYNSSGVFSMNGPASQQPHQHPPQAPQQQQQQQQYVPYHASSTQHQSSAPSNENPTLPPLQSTNTSYAHLPSLYTGSQHASSPQTPHTASSSSASTHNNPHGYTQMTTPVTNSSMPPPSSFTSIPAHYASSQGHHPASSNMPGAPGLHANVGNRLPDLRPAPHNAFNGSPFPSYSPSNGMHPQGYLQQEQEPTHVVGSQGRRGVLPSAPGRAAPPAAGQPAVTTKMMPQKDKDGKFPCPHCNKTYLHAKHLKRHLLRHTGDRPYMCHLCKDTFSRSDILKRHFQKCSIRRGNPTGANHLAHQRRNTNPSNRLSMSNETIGLASLPGVAGAPPYTNGDMVNGVTSSPTVNGDQSSYASSVASMSNRSSRANSLIQPGGLHADGRHNMTGLGMSNLSSHTSNGDHMQGTSAGYTPHVPAFMRPHSQSNPVAPSYSYGPAVTNGMYNGVKNEEAQASYGGQNPHMQHNWGHIFNPNGQDGFMAQHQQDHGHMPAVKGEPPLDGQHYNGPSEGNHDSFMNGMYSHPTSFNSGDGVAHE